MRRNLGDIEYNQDAALYAGLEFPELCPETCPDVAHSVDVLLVTQEPVSYTHLDVYKRQNICYEGRHKNML